MLLWILFFSILMCTISLVGAVTFFWPNEKVEKSILPLVALSSGSLLGGAFFHMIPEALENLPSQSVFILVFLGFSLLFIVEQFFHYHHCHRGDCHKPLGYLVLLADAIHKFIGGLTMGSLFFVNIQLGVTVFLIEAIHEVPHKLGDFAALIHSGWNRVQALIYNVVSSSTFILGALMSYLWVKNFKPDLLVAFAAGNFIYIAASDLVPEIKQYFGWKRNLLHVFVFLFGAFILAIFRFLSPHLH